MRSVAMVLTVPWAMCGWGPQGLNGREVPEEVNGRQIGERRLTCMREKTEIQGLILVPSRELAKQVLSHDGDTS
jgi:hypothetical protein